MTDRFLDPLLASTRTLLVGLAVVTLVVLVTGPYPWAVRLRREVGDLPSRLGPRPGATDAVPHASAWLRDHAGAVRVGGLVAAVALLLVVDLSFAGVVVLAGAVAAGAALLRTAPAAGTGGPTEGAVDGR